MTSATRFMSIASFVVALSTNIVSLCSAEQDDGSPAPKFQGTADLVDEIQIAKGVSEDQHATTVIFRNLQAAVGNAGGIVVSKRSISVELPVVSGGHDVRVVQDIRGFVDVQGKARAILVVQAAGKTTVIDLSKPADGAAKKATKSKSVQQASEQALKATKKEDPPASGQDFVHRIETTLPAGRSYLATFFLLVERDSDADENSALATVDSLDVELSASQPTKKK